MTTLLTISGSLRAGSYNRKLLAEAVRLFGPATVTEADLRLPLYDGDLEDAEGIPDAVTTLHGQIGAADGVLIATPEYNKALPGVLKNALDWVSRVKGPSPWTEKPVVIMSAAAGRAGGERSQFSLRLCMVPFRVRIVPGPEILVAGAAKEFGEDGRLGNELYLKAITETMDLLKADIARG